MIRFSGIADEAGQGIDTQIRAQKELGWDYVEIRNVDGMQFTELSDEKFEEVSEKLAAANINCSSFASGIANWATKITDPFEKSVTTLQRSIPRMHRLGTQFIRVMSYPNDGLAESEWGDEVVRRMRELGKMAVDGGITIVVENCDGWASTSPENYSLFFDLVDSPAVKAVYDTGNPAAHGDLNAWSWYQLAKPHIAYVHIKAHTGPGGDHVWPDMGASDIEETLRDLVTSNYDGFVSIEPHLKAVVHEGKAISDEEAAYQTYVEYGRRVMALLERVSG